MDAFEKKQAHEKVLEEARRAKEAAAVKDQMVWMLLQEREELKTTEKKYSEEVEKLSQESCKEI